jgi:hypothetical protein
MKNQGKPQEPVVNLGGVPADSYGASHREHLLEIYKLYVEMADRIGARRDRANSFFVAANAALLAVLWKLITAADAQPGIEGLLPPFAGILLCAFWRRTITSYKQLSSGKFKVILAMETSLPLEPFRAEWDALGKGSAPQLYRPLTRIEACIPVIFALLYGLLTVSVAVRVFWM